MVPEDAYAFVDGLGRAVTVFLLVKSTQHWLIAAPLLVENRAVERIAGHVLKAGTATGVGHYVTK